MKHRLALAAILALVLATGVVALVPAVRAQVGEVLARWFHFETPDAGGDVGMSSAEAFTPLRPTYLPAGLVGGHVGAVQEDNRTTAIQLQYYSDEQFVTITQSKAPAERTLPDGQEVSVNDRPAVLLTGIRGGVSIFAPPEELEGAPPPYPYDHDISFTYLDGKELTWYVGDARIEMLSNLPVEEMLKIAESLVPVEVAEGPTIDWPVDGGGGGRPDRMPVPPPVAPTATTRPFPIRATISLDGEEYRVGEEMAIEFRLENVSEERVFVSVFDRNSWAGYCVLLTPDGRKIEGYFPREIYLPYIELADHDELITSELVELEPGESYVYEYRSFLREAPGQVEMIWVYPLYWGRTPDEVAQKSDWIDADEVSVTIKPSLGEERFNEALSGMVALDDRYEWWELLEDPDPYRRAAAAHLLRLEMYSQVADVRYFDFPADRLRVDLERLAVDDETPLVRVEAAWAWLHWSLGTFYQGSKGVIPVLVNELINADPSIRSVASAACMNFANLANFTEERPANGEVFLDALLSQIEGEDDQAVEMEMLYVLLNYLNLFSLEPPGVEMDRARIVGGLNWGLQTGDNDLCLQILTHHSEWVTSPRSVPYLTKLLHHDGANNSGDIRRLAAQILTRIHLP